MYNKPSSPRRIATSRANGALSTGPATVPGKLAALANSAKSTGPRTPEGKARVARNALRHGILAESVVLDSESREAFSEILATLEDEIDPVTPIESRYVEKMALAEWRMYRLLCIEKEQLAIESARQQANDLAPTPAAPPSAAATPDAAPAPAPGPGSSPGSIPSNETVEISAVRYTALAFKSMADNSRAQELLNRYEARYDRQYNRAFAALRAYRAERRREKNESAKQSEPTL